MEKGTQAGVGTPVAARGRLHKPAHPSDGQKPASPSLVAQRDPFTYNKGFLSFTPCVLTLSRCSARTQTFPLEGAEVTWLLWEEEGGY